MMKQDGTTYYVWIGASCDYQRTDRPSAYAYIIEREGRVLSRCTSGSLESTEFRMILRGMADAMDFLPENSDIVFLTNVAYSLNFDREPTGKSANADLVLRCMEAKKRHLNVGVRIVKYHKSPYLIESHGMATETMRYY